MWRYNVMGSCLKKCTTYIFLFYENSLRFRLLLVTLCYLLNLTLYLYFSSHTSIPISHQTQPLSFKQIMAGQARLSKRTKQKDAKIDTTTA